MIDHTPGPWFQSHREGFDGMWSTEVYDARGETIAVCTWYPSPQPNGVIGTAREANARLMAAAPDMLEALKWVASVVRHKSFCPAAEKRGACDCGLGRVDAAIAKAIEPVHVEAER